MTKITPRGKYILVRPDEESNKENEFGLITPSNVEEEKKAMGEVIAVGAEIKDVVAGQRVIFGTYSGDTVQITEEGKEVDYKLLHDDDVLAFIEN
jgi:co-chaperonin GroES (HSP10)